MSKAHYLENVHSYNCLPGTREIFLHGYIGETEGEDPGVEYRMVNNFLKNMRFLEAQGQKPIIIHQHNIGGFWESGMIMYDVIKTSSCYVIMVLHGEAMSMGSIIPQAADLRVAMPNCTFMIHDGSTDINDGYTMKQAQSRVDMEKRTTAVMMDMYVEKCIHGSYFTERECSEATVRKFLRKKMDLKEDWYLYGEEIVTYGFADTMLGQDYKTLEEVRKIQ